jgi:hypothetical protein
MQKELEINVQVRLIKSQYGVLKTVADASGDTLDECLHTVVIQGIESDIEPYLEQVKILRRG